MVDDSGFDELLADQAIKSGDQEGQLGRQGLDFETLPTFDTKYLYIWNARIREQKQEITSGFVVGHPLFSIVGVAEVGPLTSDIILTGVTSQDNEFPEFFNNDRFIDSGSSTGSWNDITREYLLGPGSDLETYTIAWQNGKIIKNAKITMSADNTTDLDVTLHIGSSFTHTFSQFGVFESLAANTSQEETKLVIENTSVGSNITMDEYIFEYTTVDAT